MSITRRATRFQLCISAVFFFVPATLVLATQSSTAMGASDKETKLSIPVQAQHTAYAPTCDPNWNKVPSPNPGNGSFLHGITAIASNDVWAVGGYIASSGYPSYPTLAEHWDGTSWSVISTPNVGTYQNVLKGVDAVSSNDVWAVGWYILTGDSPTRALIQHWDGSAWSIIPSPSVGEHHTILEGVTAIASNDVWAVGWYSTEGGSRALIEHWDGSAWSIVSEPASESGSQLYGVTAVSSSDIWAVGIQDGTAMGQTLTKHWDGSVWSVVPSPGAGPDDPHTASYLYGVDAIASNDVWAVGNYFDTEDYQTTTLIEHWDGSVWSVVPSPDAGPYDDSNSYLSGVAAIASNDVWAVGRFGNGALIEHWNGSAWSVVPAASGPTDHLSQVDAIASNDVWAVGRRSSQTLIERYNPCTGPPSCPGFSDVPEGSTFHPFVKCLACKEILGGYPDGTFRPQNLITRGQIAKIVSNAAGYSDDVSGMQTYADVPSTQPFHEWIERLSMRGHMGGYTCGGGGEACDGAKRPYFRPGSNATRGQLSKIVSNAAQFEDTPTGQTFQDVPPSSPFYLFIERLTSRGVMSGYPCGGAGEPCQGGNRPYFRPSDNVTRGQASKIVANTFFPNCQSQSPAP